MNISLSGAKEKGRKRSLEYGLNNRSTNPSNIAKNVFDDDDSSDADDIDKKEKLADSFCGGGRKAVNQQIVKEQAALRKRAQAAMAQVQDPTIYDYDGAYDTFKSNNDADEQLPRKTSKITEERKSKYIDDLLKAAKIRERERDVIYERRIAREQAAEDAKDEYSGKEKFISKAYQRKLEERRQWELEQEEKEREEAANDVTKKSAGVAMANFYGNLNKNVALGGKDDTTNQEHVEKTSMESLNDFDPRGDFMQEFERSTDPQNEGQVKEIGLEEKIEIMNDRQNLSSTLVAPAMSTRERREKKVAEARIRYLNRKQAAMEE
jgi:coiled-coil domain-containing protein 55